MIFTPIGGEFWYDKNIVTKCSETVSGYFLNGGRSSLSCICKYLRQVGKNNIMVPSYLCPTILDVFDNERMNYMFYDINEDFSINISSIEKNIGQVESIMFINYFGLSLSDIEMMYLTSLKNNNKVLIEDKVHTISNQYFGDFAFNSFRKFLPISGSLLQTDINIGTIINDLEMNESYIDQIKKARALKTDCIVNNKGSEEGYLLAFKLAESLYYQKFAYGSPSEKALLEKINFVKIKRIRNKNYKYLQNLLMGIEDIKIIFKDIGSKTPLGLPIYVTENKREVILNRLKLKQIYLPVHWNLKSEKRIKNNTTKIMSDRIITLIIDQRYKLTDLDRLVCEIETILG